MSKAPSDRFVTVIRDLGRRYNVALMEYNELEGYNRMVSSHESGYSLSSVEDAAKQKAIREGLEYRAPITK